jgi:hypothetical protein
MFLADTTQKKIFDNLILVPTVLSTRAGSPRASVVKRF